MAKELGVRYGDSHESGKAKENSESCRDGVPARAEQQGQYANQGRKLRDSVLTSVEARRKSLICSLPARSTCKSLQLITTRALQRMDRSGQICGLTSCLRLPKLRTSGGKGKNGKAEFLLFGFITAKCLL